MTTFRMGQKVVCIDDRPTDLNGHCALVKNEIYTIRWIGQFEWQLPCYHSGLGICVNGIARYCPITDHLDIPFDAFRFRPLVEKKTDISIFERMLTSDKIKERI